MTPGASRPSVPARAVQAGNPRVTTGLGGAKPVLVLPALALVLNAFIWGVSWWPFRELQGHGLHPLWATTLVYCVSLILLLAFKPRAERGFAREPVLWLLALASGVTNVGFNWAVTVGDVVRVVLL